MNDKWLDKMIAASPRAKHIAWSGEVRLAGAREDDRIGRTVKLDIVRMPEDAMDANPFAAHTRRRAGHGGTRFELALTEIVDANTLTKDFMEEVMLLNWNDGPKGPTVTFMLQPGAQAGGSISIHPFMYKDRGTAYMAVFVELGDDDVAVNQQKRTLVERGAQKQSNAAAQIIKNPHYWEWRGLGLGPGTDNAACLRAADADLKEICGIESKSQLDSDPDAVRLFRQHLDDFVAWQEDKGYL